MATPTAGMTAESVQIDDRQLQQRAASGDTAAFEAIMRRHNRRLYRTARSIVRDDAEAEEALQEGYLRAYRALSSFRGESSVATWLTRIVINQALGRLRQRSREVATIAADNVVDLEGHIDPIHEDRLGSETPEIAAMRAQTRKLLERRIDELPAAFRTVFVLRALEEMPTESIAACLDIEEATVRTRYLRARRLLRRSLEADVGGTIDEAFAFDGERCDRIVAAVLNVVSSASDGI
jgi:RNA polymerase sigma-70 factor (ECF subfamily)